MATWCTRDGAPGNSPVSGWPWPRLHQLGSRERYPRRCASEVTKITPVRGTARNAGMAISSATGGSVTPAGAAAEKSARQAALEVAVRPRLREERARVVHLAPGIPEQDAAHPAVAQVIDDAFAERDLPVGDGLQTRIDLAHCLVTEVEEVRVEHRHVAPGDGRARHGLAGQATHRVRIVLVLHPDFLLQH